jgi:hypothetical protein
LHVTPFGLTGVVPATPGEVTVTVTAHATLDAHFAVTTANAQGLIVDAWDAHAPLTAAPGTTSRALPQTGANVAPWLITAGVRNCSCFSERW